MISGKDLLLALNIKWWFYVRLLHCFLFCLQQAFLLDPSNQDVKAAIERTNKELAQIRRSKIFNHYLSFIIPHFLEKKMDIWIKHIHLCTKAIVTEAVSS